MPPGHEGNYDVIDQSVFGAAPEPAFFDRLHTGGKLNGMHFSNSRIDATWSADGSP